MKINKFLACFLVTVSTPAVVIADNNAPVNEADQSEESGGISPSAEKRRNKEGVGAGSQIGGEERIQIVRYIGGNAGKWAVRSNDFDEVDRNFVFSDLYTNFIVYLNEGEDSNGAGSDAGNGGSEGANLRDYAGERPNWLNRLFSSQERSVVAVARISLINPSLEMTIPLYSMSYNSGGEDGESWATSMTASNVSSPLFRISGNSRFTLTVKTSTSDATQASGFSTAISALTSAVDLVAPNAGLLTTLNEESTSARASALDGAISDLLTYSISEEISFGRSLNDWREGSQITLEGCAPFLGDHGQDQSSGSSNCSQEDDFDGDRNRHIGEWNLTMTCPRFSVFSPRDVCNRGQFQGIVDAGERNEIQSAIALVVADSLILEEQLGANSTIRSVIRGSDFFIGIVGEEERSKDEYGNFCAATMSALRQTGLNGFDSALGLRATLRLMPEFVGESSQHRTIAPTGSDKLTVCENLLGRYDLTIAG